MMDNGWASTGKQGKISCGFAGRKVAHATFFFSAAGKALAGDEERILILAAHVPYDLAARMRAE